MASWGHGGEQGFFRTHGLLGASQRVMEEKFRNASVQAIMEKNRKERESSGRVWS